MLVPWRRPVVALLTLSALAHAQDAGAPPAPPARAIPRLDDTTFDELWPQIVPRPNELEWLEIPWLGVLADAVAQARQADQPVLLWAMNGHPLGCT
jgi:hypothetical protein